MSPKKRQHKSDQSSNKKSKSQLSDSDVESDPGSENNLNGDNDNYDATEDGSVQFPIWDGNKGRLLICGGTNWDLIGRKELPKNAKNAANVSTGKINFVD